MLVHPANMTRKKDGKHIVTFLFTSRIKLNFSAMPS